MQTRTSESTFKSFVVTTVFLLFCVCVPILKNPVDVNRMNSSHISNIILRFILIPSKFLNKQHRKKRNEIDLTIPISSIPLHRVARHLTPIPVKPIHTFSILRSPRHSTGFMSIYWQQQTKHIVRVWYYIQITRLQQFRQRRGEHRGTKKEVYLIHCWRIGKEYSRCYDYNF